MGLQEGVGAGAWIRAAQPLSARYRRRAVSRLIDGVCTQLACLGRLHPYAQAHRQNVVDLIGDVPYLNSGLSEHLLDIYRPVSSQGPWPIVLYVHGGGFRILSKESHWFMAMAFARRGYLVFNINYRLAPRSTYPSALEDVCAAYRWVIRNAAAFGGDLGRIVLAGESAGANLVTALTVANCYDRPEPWAARVFDADVRPRVVIPACGFLQVSDPGRFVRSGATACIMSDYIRTISESYVTAACEVEGGDSASVRASLADPLIVLERETPSRALPSFFIPVGSRDPLVDDSRRLERALRHHGVDAEAKYYDDEPHSFHAFLWRRKARVCWGDTFGFLSTRMGHTAVVTDSKRSTFKRECNIGRGVHHPERERFGEAQLDGACCVPLVR